MSLLCDIILTVLILGIWSIEVPSQNVVAFHAVRTSTQAMSGGDAILFNLVFTNINHDYDPTTGAFTCRIPGVYVFHFHVLDEIDGKLMFVRLMKNGQSVSDIWANTANSIYELAGNSAVLTLQKGDIVDVREGSGFPNTVWGDSDKRYTTFSGYMIAQTTADAGSKVLG